MRVVNITTLFFMVKITKKLLGLILILGIIFKFTLINLEKLQAMGLAQGVSLDNTLGLKDDGGYTSELRSEFSKIVPAVIVFTISLLTSPFSLLPEHLIAFDSALMYQPIHTFDK